MSWNDCVACRDNGTKPKEGGGFRVVHHPGILGGNATLDGHRLGAEFMAMRAWHHGISQAASDYELKRGQLLVCCWWVARFGTRTWRKRWAEWAKDADRHLFYGCERIPDPPTKVSA